jgi:membrane associated rhomboid family serine protease
VGISDRNYFRGSSGGWGSGPGSWPPVIKSIVLINIGVFIAQLMITRPQTIEEVRDNSYGIETEYDFMEAYIENRQNGEEFTDAELRREAELAYHEYLADMVVTSPRVSVIQQWLELDTDKVMKGQIWRMLTCAFCHDRHGLFHILFNMLGLIWFGISLEYMYGQREFLLFYLTAGILSSLAYVGLDLWTGESVPAIGASGAVMGVLMLFACHYPHYTIRIWFLFPIEMRWLVLLYVAFDLHPLLLQLAGDQVYTGVAHAAHLGGLAFGYVYWNQQLRLSPMVDSIQNLDLEKWLRRKTNSSLKLHSPNAGNDRMQASEINDAGSLDQDRVDELLTKITEVGRDKLTEEELGILRQASERLRQKKK